MKNAITWSSKLVEVSKIKPTEKNYKIKTALGKARLQESLKSFGLAGNVVLNTDLMLIDGNSRLAEAIENKEKKIWASLPSRKLSPAEFREMSAMFDFAKAGEVDVERIKQDLGTSSAFISKYKMEVPEDVLAKLGKFAPTTVKTLAAAKKLEAPTSTTIAVTLIFSMADHAAFRKIEERLQKKYNTADTGATILKALKSI